ncbi:MAG: dihydroorotase [Cyclobacteriaceae bacterium]
MKIRLANATIFAPSSKLHLKKTDILINNGVIEGIGKSDLGKVIDLKGKIVGLGWCDLFAHFNEPGLEHKEDISSGMACAVAGGFTDVCLLPNTQPPVQTKGDVKFILGKSGVVNLWPLAALSEGLKGENLTEILDMQSHGAVAFTDGLNCIWNSELLLKALQYVQKFEGLVIQKAKDPGLSQHAQMHEGVVSTGLGLNGEPSLAEELIIQRDIEILKYAGGRLHFSQVSSKRSVALIKKAKKDGLAVTCDVAVAQLLFNEQNLEDFDTNYKVDPPYRTELDRKALIKGLIDGTIDAITSSHQPQDQECKELEFDLADFGQISMQLVYPMLLEVKDELPLEISFDKLANGARKILGFDLVSIAEGQKAQLAVFDPDLEWDLNLETNKSRSQNTPYWGKTIKGKSLGIINGEQIALEKF